MANITRFDPVGDLSRFDPFHDLETAFGWESKHWIETTRADTSRMLKALTPGGHQGLKGGEGRHWLIPKASIMRLASPRAMRL